MKGHRCIVDLNEITLIDSSGETLLRTMLREGAQFIANGVYTKHVVEQLNIGGKRGISKLLTRLFAGLFLALLAVLVAATSVTAQNATVTGSVPSGPARNQVFQLTLRDAIKMALRYNLGAIVQTSLATLGIKNLAGIPTVIGPYSYSSADLTLSQTLFSFSSIQRFRAARTAERAAQLSYQDMLDAVTLTVGNAYLQVTEADSRIKAQEAQVHNAQALYSQALNEVEAGTAPRMDATRTEVQLHTEEYNLSVARSVTSFV